MTWTISSILDWTTLYFTKHGIENPHLEAEILLAHALLMKRIDLYVNHDKALNDEQLAAFKKLVLRRVKKEPTAYIIGHKPFMSLEFEVSKDVLIPRPDTEKLVEAVIDLSKKGMNAPAILDIGTGSGAVAVSLAYYIKDADITATDISQKAIEIAGKNAVKHSVENRINFITGNLFENIPKDKSYDIILSNPPYIPTEEIKKLQPEITGFEPVNALDGGKDGLDYFRKIVDSINGFLKPGGYLLFEIGFGQADKVVEIINAKGIFEDIKVEKDHSEIDRIVMAKKAA